MAQKRQPRYYCVKNVYFLSLLLSNKCVLSGTLNAVMQVNAVVFPCEYADRIYFYGRYPAVKIAHASVFGKRQLAVYNDFRTLATIH